MRRRSWELAEEVLDIALRRRRELEAERNRFEQDGEKFDLPAEGELAAEADGSLPSDTTAVDLAKALEELRDLRDELENRGDRAA